MTAAVALLVVTAAVALAATGGAAAHDTGRHVVVVADAAQAARATAEAERLGADLRLPRTPTEQLSVTRLFAARGYAIVGIGLIRRIAVDPVAARYPATRFVLLPAPGIPRRVAACPPSC